MEQKGTVFSSTCILCSKKMGFFNGKIILKDGYVCNDCWAKNGLNKRINYITEGRNYTASQIRDLVNTIKSTPINYSVFKTNTLISDLIQLDDKTQTVQIITKKGYNSTKEYIKYNQIVSFELIEDGETITNGGLGAAVAGGMMFGIGGAVVGAAVGQKKTKPVCNSLQIRISVKDYYTKTIFVTYIETPTKSISTTYKQMHVQARKAIAELQVALSIAEENVRVSQNASVNSLADEIVKLNTLFEQGVISKEEFDNAKRKVLS